MIIVTGSANGLLPYAVLKNLNRVGGWLALRWIFIEGKNLSPHVMSTGFVATRGLMSVGSALVVLALLPVSPESLRWFFTAAEKDIVMGPHGNYPLWANGSSLATFRDSRDTDSIQG